MEALPDPRPSAPGIHGPFASLYDVFVDWNGRLGRELPGLRRHLDAVGARRVLDAGCGTGRHVAALRAAGYEADGADASAEMLERASELLGGGEGLHPWTLGSDPPASLVGAGPFDAVVAMGNVWPQLRAEDEARRAAEGILRLLRPGGLVVLGLKALALRAERGDPYMPLLAREHEGRPLWFVRFVDFGPARLADGTRICDFHMVVVAGAAGTPTDCLLHDASRMRVWGAAELGAWFETAGFAEVRVSGRLDDPTAPVASEDVFVAARRP